MKKKVILTVMALALVLCFAIGGTLAWLKAQTSEVKNTFTYGDINITLDEADVNDENGNNNTTERVTSQEKYKMIPGTKLKKDPKVTVKANSEACWLFIKIEESDNFDNFMTYKIDTNVEGKFWTQLKDSSGEAVEGVYYIEVSAETAKDGVDYYVLEDNQVTVLGTVTKASLNALDTNADGTKKDAAAADYPTLTFTAYAVQREGFSTATAAWAEITNPTDATIN